MTAYRWFGGAGAWTTTTHWTPHGQPISGVDSVTFPGGSTVSAIPDGFIFNGLNFSGSGTVTFVGSATTGGSSTQPLGSNNGLVPTSTINVVLTDIYFSTSGSLGGGGGITLNGATLKGSGPAAIGTFKFDAVPSGGHANVLDIIPQSTGLKLLTLGYGDTISTGTGTLSLTLNSGSNPPAYTLKDAIGPGYTVTTSTDVTLAPGTIFADFHSGANGTLTYTGAAPCFRGGTAIRTQAGDFPVESLKEGDLVALADGSFSPIVWIGHRKLDCARHPNPNDLWPILVREGAFGEKMPARDLYLSPGHSVFVEGVLMQAEKLINGATILQIETDTVEYWHVELENHAILLAENLPAESYLDQGNRCAFMNGGAFVEAHPGLEPKHWLDTCVKLVLEGPEMHAAKASLLARAAVLGYETTHDGDLHVMADGKRIDLVELGDSRVAFILPAGAQTISLQSRTFVPAHVNPLSGDKRSLGIQVQRLQLDGVDIALDDETAFATGWHEVEMRGGRADRWTTGETKMPPGTRLIMIECAGQGLFWAERERPQDNVVVLYA